MRYVFSIGEIDEVSYQQHLDEFLNFIPELKNYLSPLIERNGEVLIMNIPSTFYKNFKVALSVLPETRDNPLYVSFLFPENSDEIKQMLHAEQTQLLIEAHNSRPEQNNVSSAAITLPSTITFDNFFGPIWQQFPSQHLVIGESHNYLTALQLLIDNVTALREHNALVVLENFCSDTAQNELDQCFKEEKLSPLLKLLTPIIHEKDGKEAGDLKIKMLETFFQNKIRVVAGDNEISNSINANQPKERITAMNYIAVKNVKSYKEKYSIDANIPVVYLVGYRHALTEKTIDSYPGLVQLTQGIHILTEDLFNNIKASEGVKTVVIKQNAEIPTLKVQLAWAKPPQVAVEEEPQEIWPEDVELESEKEPFPEIPYATAKSHLPNPYSFYFQQPKYQPQQDSTAAEHSEAKATFGK
jgi:hypothetical protein